MTRATVALQAIKTELDSDPVKYTGSHAQKAAAMNEPIASGTVRVRVDMGEVKKYALKNNFWLAVEDASTSHADANVKIAARAAMAYVEGAHGTDIDMDDAAVVGMLALLVGGGVITQDNSNGLSALANKTIYTSRAKIVVGDEVTGADIQGAMSI